MFKEYFEYLKNNPEGYWFKRKLYGWRWTPVRWQGWLVIFVYIVAVVGFGLTINEDSPAREVVFTFIIPVVLLTLTLLRICYKTGEKPKWQWGNSDKIR